MKTLALMAMLASCSDDWDQPPTCAEVAQAWCVWPHRCPEVGSPEACVANVEAYCVKYPDVPQVSRACVEALRDPSVCVWVDRDPAVCW